MDASVINTAKGSTDRPSARCVADNACPACAASLDSIDDADIATMHTIIPRDRKAAIVLAAVKGEALTRQPDGRPGPPLRATALGTLAGTKEWSVF